MNNMPQYAGRLPEGHPVKVYFEESLLIQSLIQEVVNIDANEDFETFYNVFNHFLVFQKYQLF